MSDWFNLGAAILCALAGAVGLVAVALSPPSIVNTLTGVVCGITVLSGVLWAIAAELSRRQR